MSTYGDIRTRFQIAMDRDNVQLNESIERNLLSIANSPDNNEREKLYNIINENYFDGKAPFERINLNSFSSSNMTKVDKILSKNKSAANILVNIGAEITGVGRGEIMFAYIIENCSVGGGSADIDLSLHDNKNRIIDQVECKEVNKTTDNYLNDWRTAARHRPIIKQAILDLKNLYNNLKDVLPELSTETVEGRDIQSKVARDEGSKFINIVKNIDPVIVTNPLAFSIKLSPEDELLIQHQSGENIGNITDTKTIDKLKSLLSKENKVQLKSYKQIEKELVEGFGKIDEKFVFVRTIGNTKKYGAIYFKNNISGKVGETLIDRWTGGTIKVKVKI